jgi:uncharacterized membrane protein YgcG
MANLRWVLAISVALAAIVVTTPVPAATIRDSAGMFSPAVVKKLEAELDRLERTTKIPVVIETIDAIPGLDKDAPTSVRRKAIDQLAVKRDKAIRDEGIYLLISKHDKVFSPVLIRERYAALLPVEKRDAIRDALHEEFKQGNYDAGLTRAVETIEQALEKATVVNRGAKVPGVLPRRAEAGQSTMGTFLMILLAIVAVLVVLRILGGLLSRSGSSGYPGQMGGMGMQRPGMGQGPGYFGGGGGGYGGGRGGGFFSSLMGGIGGAVAGNWLYDQFSGRHGNAHSAETYSPDPGAGVPDQGGDAIIGANDDPGGGTSWDDGGGGNDAGGGDWGGGGGDWGGGGGGGGDWGGGGGDWGGGGGDGGGGDW